MGNTRATMAGQGSVMPAEPGSKFVRWGVVQFLIGLIVGFVPLPHYFHGVVAGDVGPVFLKKRGVWYVCNQ